MIHYILSPEAMQDIREIRIYLMREAGPQIAKSTLGKIRDAFLLLSREPSIGHSREDLTPDAVKFWSVFSYMIVYDPARRPIDIVRVLHGGRDVASVLSQPTKH